MELKTNVLKSPSSGHFDAGPMKYLLASSKTAAKTSGRQPWQTNLSPGKMVAEFFCFDHDLFENEILLSKRRATVRFSLAHLDHPTADGSLTELVSKPGLHFASIDAPLQTPLQSYRVFYPHMYVIGQLFARDSSVLSTKQVHLTPAAFPCRAKLHQ